MCDIEPSITRWSIEIRITPLYHYRWLTGAISNIEITRLQKQIQWITFNSHSEEATCKHNDTNLEVLAQDRCRCISSLIMNHLNRNRSQEDNSTMGSMLYLLRASFSMSPKALLYSTWHRKDTFGTCPRTMSKLCLAAADRYLGGLNYDFWACSFLIVPSPS